MKGDSPLVVTLTTDDLRALVAEAVAVLRLVEMQVSRAFCVHGGASFGLAPNPSRHCEERKRRSNPNLAL